MSPQELTDVYELIVIGACLVASAFFSASETAVTSLGSLKAKHKLDSEKKAVRELNLWLNHPGRVLTTILIFNNVVNILASVVATDLATRHFESQALGIATGGVTFFVLIFGEIIPKSFAKANHERLAVPILRIIYVLYAICFPIVWALSQFAHGIVQAFGDKSASVPPITEEELGYLIKVGQQAGVLQDTKKEMLDGVFEIEETKVREIMTPRTDMVSLERDCNFDEALQSTIESGFSRIPIYGDDGLDHVIGVMLAKDLLRTARAGTDATENFKMEEMMREPMFVPESKLVIDVFRDLKKSKSHMAVVIDEHGGTAGLITMEDILEEIVGEIQDEYDIEEADFLELENGLFDVAGSVNIDNFLDFFELDDSEFQEERDPDIDTLAGWITQIHGDLPEVGEKVSIGPLRVEVSEVERQRVQRVRVTRQ